MAAKLLEGLPGASDQSMCYGARPLLIYWEMTQACDLACKHCRATAISNPHPMQLSLSEGRNLLREFCDFGEPLPNVVLTGGDPMKRPDLFHLMEYGNELGLPISLAPAVTERLSQEALQRIKSLGVRTISLSLDGATAESHDGFRGVPGCFDHTIEAAKSIRELDIPLQINTLVTSNSLDDLFQTFELVRGLDIIRWSLFFLIEVGRGRSLRALKAAESEILFHRLYDLSKTVDFSIKATEALHYRRVAYRRMLRDGYLPEEIRNSPTGRGFGIRDGNGVMFVSHRGDVYPSGFLPMAAGNVRFQSPVDIYRHAPLFKALRDPDSFRGKCGVCEYNWICGGSRARAFATTGDPLESDPLCVYLPSTT